MALSSFTTTCHIGAHADAPSHYSKNGLSVEGLKLEPYVGPCVVKEVTGGRVILPSHCKGLPPRAERVLFRTGYDAAEFRGDFSFFSPEAIRYLGEMGVVLVCIDTPSVDAFDSKDLPCHHELLSWNMRNLEGLDLSAAPEGEYELIALPLKLKGMDASPVRAILRCLPVFE